MNGLFADLARLEDLRVDPDADLDALLQTIAERQRLIDRVQANDIQSLPEPELNDVKRRLRGILEATRTISNRLQKRQQQLRDRQTGVVQARHAARGYRPDMAEEKRPVRRRA